MAQKKSPMSLPSDGYIVLPHPSEEGETVKYPFLEPTPEQLAIFAADATHNDLFGRMAGVLNFIDDILADPNDAFKIRSRLRDRNDPLDFGTLFAQVRVIMEENTGFPTQPPSASGNSPSTTGRRSTGKVQPGE